MKDEGICVHPSSFILHPFTVMSLATPAEWPPSRVLAGWQPHLSRYGPRAIWLHHVALHHVEAQVVVVGDAPTDQMNRLVLEVLYWVTSAANPPGSAVSVGRLVPYLHLDPQILNRLLIELEAAGLVFRTSEDQWGVTDPAILETPTPVSTLRERRTFHFTACMSPLDPARFLPLRDPPGLPWPDVESWTFDPGILRSCLEQSLEWKQQHGFPLDVQRVRPTPVPVPASAQGWEQIITDRPEHFLGLFLQTAEDSLIGFAVHANGWDLSAEEPVLEVGPVWREMLPDLTVEPSQEQWRESWLAWGQQRGLSAEELDACRLEESGDTVRVQVPEGLLEQLRKARSDVLKGETWLLVGSDRTRRAARVQIQE